MTFAEIVRLLVADDCGPGPVSRPTRGPGDTIRFHCPRCQRRWRDQELHGPRAVTFDQILWECTVCRAIGTRWQLEAIILGRPDCVRRLRQQLEVAA